jgi:hypothetical protein
MPKAAALQNANQACTLRSHMGSWVGAVRPPLLILALGLAMRWALLGFRPRIAG